MTILLQTKIDTLYAQQKDLEQAFKPLFYRIYNENDRIAFSQILDKPGILLTDYVLDQVKELMKITHPHLKLSPQEQEEAALQHITPLSIKDYGVWVYYPWSNRLVHIVDEKEFVELRTSRNQYKITREERDLLARKKIGVIGLSVGQSVATTLAMERIAGEIRLADFDVLELTNLNRIRTGIHNIGHPKVYVVAREIAEIDPFILVQCFSQGITENNMNDFLIGAGKLDLILEESDSFDVKVLIRHKARELGIPVVMESSDKCMVDVERFDLEPSRSILHGLIDQLDIAKLKSLKTNEEKIPYMLDILGIDTLSSRLKASMLEIGKSITTWPQLASSVVMGGGIAADVSRRILLDQFHSSGRYYVDIDTLISDSAIEQTSHSPSIPANELGTEEMLHLIHQLPPSTTDLVLEENIMQQLVEAGMRATLTVKTLKWKWVSQNSTLFLFEDRIAHVSSVKDQTNSLTALGSVLENISIQAQQLHLSTVSTLYPHPTNHCLLAKITFEPIQQISSAEELHTFIGLQTTADKKKNQPIDPKILHAIKTAAEETKGIALDFFTDVSELKKLKPIIAACDRLLILNTVIQSQYESQPLSSQNLSNILQQELRLHDLSINDNIKLAVVSDPNVATLLNKWQKGQVLEEFSTYPFSSLIGLIRITSAELLNYVNAGRALQRAFLMAMQHETCLTYIPSFSLLYTSLHHHQSAQISASISEQLHIQFKNLCAIHPDLAKQEAFLLFRLSHAEPCTENTAPYGFNNVFFKL
jgi:tRNA A37 threonylcarbamoyladenosine dehydratase